MKPVKLGITGGIGSGKTIVCRVLEQLGIPVYYADAESKKLLENDPGVITRVIQLFGKEAYLPDGKPNRPFIASVVFSNPQKLDELNGILHPVVHEHFRQWVSQQNAMPIVAKEAAIMFESGSYREMDFVAVITAPEKLRIQRVAERDNKNEEEIRKIIKQQLPEEEIIKRSDFIIINDDHTLMIPQVLDMVKKLQKQTGQHNSSAGNKIK